MLKNGFEIGKVDSILFTRKVDNQLFVCQIYVDDIIFGSTDETFSEKFSRVMTNRFEMSMMGELKYFLGFQVKQLKEGTFLCQTKYTKDMLKKFGMEKAKHAKTPMVLSGYLDLNEEGKTVHQKGKARQDTNCCAQLLWMKQTLRDFGCDFKRIPLLCDNESAIKLANNPVQHSTTKHIDIRHHFLRDHEAKKKYRIMSCKHRKSTSRYLHKTPR